MIPIFKVIAMDKICKINKAFLGCHVVKYYTRFLAPQFKMKKLYTTLVPLVSSASILSGNIQSSLERWTIS